MDKTDRRLIEIIGHLDAIIEQMKEDNESLIKATILKLYAVEIEQLVTEMKTLLDYPQ